MGLVLGAALRALGLRIARRTKVAWDDRLVRAATGPVKALLGLAAFATGAGVLRLPAPAQAVRLGDVVVVDGEWGTIEEITLTDVVLKVWDLRRLVIPIDRFLKTPFQNWTKVAPDLLGTVLLYADYTVPVDRVRDEVAAFVKGRPVWDGRTAGLVVTNVSERTVELPALISAADSSKAWDLRCALREHLVSYLTEIDGGRHLPRARVTAHDAIARLEPATDP